MTNISEVEKHEKNDMVNASIVTDKKNDIVNDSNVTDVKSPVKGDVFLFSQEE